MAMNTPHRSLSRARAAQLALAWACLSHGPAAWCEAAGAAEAGIDAALLTEAAAQQLRPRLEALSSRYTIAALRKPDTLKLPPGQVSLHAAVDERWANELAPTVRVSVGVDVDGRTVRTVPLWLALSATAPGVVAAHKLEAGRLLQAQDLQAGDVNLLEQAQGRAPTVAELAGRRLVRPVAAGQALSARLVEAMPDVVRGARVTVELAQDGIRIEAPGLALADGARGQRVAVSLGQQARMQAWVLGTGRVRLDEQEPRP